MGHLRAQEAATVMADMAGLDAALNYHLTANHYPPVPVAMIEVAKAAIELAVLAYDRDDPSLMNEPVSLPDGITTQTGDNTTPVHEVIRGLHLEAFCEAAITGDDDYEEEE